MIQTDRQALLTRLAALERKGMYWDCDVHAARTDLELLEKHTRAGEALDETVDLYETLFLDEKERHRCVDPTSPARRAIEVIDRCQEPGEDKARGVQAYRKLWDHSLKNNLFENPGESVDFSVRRNYELIDQHMLEGDDRVRCVAQFLEDPRGFPALKEQERQRRAEEEAELAGRWHSLQKPEGGALGHQEEYLIVGGARVPHRNRGCSEPA